MGKLPEVVWQASAKQTSIAIISMSPPGTPCKLLVASTEGQFHSHQLGLEVFSVAQIPKVESAMVVDCTPALTCEVLPAHQCWIGCESDSSAKLGSGCVFLAGRRAAY